MTPDAGNNEHDDENIGGERQDDCDGTACDGVTAELLMPFVTVASKDGPHEDTSYVAGWEMGALYTELEHSRTPRLERFIHASNAPQADLIAMNHGYIAEIEPTGHDDWSTLRLTRTGVD